MSLSTSQLRWLSYGVTALSLLILLLYTYANFVGMPYLGFNWDATRQVISVFGPGELQVGDRLIQVGDARLAGSATDLRQAILEGVRPRQSVRIVVERQGQLLEIDWTLPGLNSEEFDLRLWNQWWLAWCFWLFGLATLHLVRPRDVRWCLLVATFCVTAVWLGASVVSRWQIWESAIILRMAVWLSVPVYWHLHWLFPEPLPIKSSVLRYGGYAAAFSLAGLQWFQFLPAMFYIVGFVVGISGILVPFLARLWIPAQRRAIRFLGVAVVVAIAPTLITALLVSLLQTHATNELVGLLSLPFLPMAYFYAAYRRQLGGLEVRANRAISLYLFLIVLGLAAGVLVPATAGWFENAHVIAEAGTAVLAAVVTVSAFPTFRRFVERRFLSMPLPPARLLETYATRLTVSPDRDSLVRLLRDEIMPSLLVRQSALLRLDDVGGPSALYDRDIEGLPTENEWPRLLADADTYRLPSGVMERPQACPWVRLVLPLRLADQTLGVWLLGRRDPDDFYSQADISSLRGLANQTAIALAHILQTERLRQLYQANIDRDEAERGRLALELHDDILNELALLAPGIGGRHLEPQLVEAYQHVVQRVRQIVSGLRPVMLSYGLRAALEQLGDDLSDRAGERLAVRVEVDGEDARYPLHVEQHLFRIIQQAGENAVKHAHARTLHLTGALTPTQVVLCVEDDGLGLPAEAQGDLAALIERRHFGLAGMSERAAIIGAALQLHSTPGHGTRVRVIWQAAVDPSQRPG